MCPLANTTTPEKYYNFAIVISGTDTYTLKDSKIAIYIYIYIFWIKTNFKVSLKVVLKSLLNSR